MFLSHHLLRASSASVLLEKERALLARNPGASLVFKRVFLSDPAQRDAFPDQDGALSFIVQPPLEEGVEMASWLILAEGIDLQAGPGESSFRCDGVRWIWTSGLTAPGPSSQQQTDGILRRYEDRLAKQGLTLADHCVRTWFFCHDIDHLYAGLVKARREYFETVGLTPATHYIASTGIAGNPPERKRVVQMDALALEGAFRQRYLYAPTHLNPTHEYGVTFERGVRVEACGCIYTIISGTASIDNKGQVLHIGDISAQVLRMWENVDALLSESGASEKDLAQILVYLRRPEDYPLVEQLFAARFPDTPYIILHAPVCRPDWLVEMECIAQQPLP